MQSNEFIKKHIKIDDRTRISKKLSNLVDKYEEFTRYIKLIQKEDVGTIFYILNRDGYIFYSKYKEAIQHHNYKRYIAQLKFEGFIIESEYSFSSEVLIREGFTKTSRPNVYELTKKGVDFISIDYIQEYLETEYEVEE